MGKGRLCEVRGTAALAELAGPSRGEWTLIDYDIARRSYEARRRLERRQEGLSSAPENRIPAVSARMLRHDAPTSGMAESGQPRAYRVRAPRMSMQDLVREQYDPSRRPARLVGDAAAHVRLDQASRAFWYQLRDGSLAGKETGKMSYRQALRTAAVGLVLGTAIMFLGL